MPRLTYCDALMFKSICPPQQLNVGLLKTAAAGRTPTMPGAVHASANDNSWFFTVATPPSNSLRQLSASEQKRSASRAQHCECGRLRRSAAISQSAAAARRVAVQAAPRGVISGVDNARIVDFILQRATHAPQNIVWRIDDAVAVVIARHAR